MSISIKYNIDINKIAKKLLTDDMKLYANTRLYAYCDPFVPFDEGHLSQDVVITAECVHYKSPYANYIYTGSGFHFQEDHHPLATAYWDKAMKISKGNDLASDIEKAIIRSRQ